MQNIRAVTHQDKESEESFSLVSLATVHFCFVLVVEGLITVRYLHSRSRKVPMVVRDNYRQDDQKEWCLTCAEATNQRCYIPRAVHTKSTYACTRPRRPHSKPVGIAEHKQIHVSGYVGYLNSNRTSSTENRTQPVPQVRKKTYSTTENRTQTILKPQIIYSV